MRFVRLFTCLLLSALVASPLGAVTRHMFLTSVTGTGNLSTWPDAGGFTGLDAADAICQARAAAASLPNAAAYRAWISDSVDDAYCRMHNLGGKRATNCGQPTLPAAAGPWWRTDGKPFGAGLPDLLAPLEQVLNPPSVNEFGVDLQVGSAWTATGLQGVVGPATCLDWTSAASPDPVLRRIRLPDVRKLDLQRELELLELDPSPLLLRDRSRGSPAGLPDLGEARLRDLCGRHGRPQLLARRGGRDGACSGRRDLPQPRLGSRPIATPPLSRPGFRPTARTRSAAFSMTGPGCGSTVS